MIFFLLMYNVHKLKFCDISVIANYILMKIHQKVYERTFLNVNINPYMPELSFLSIFEIRHRIGSYRLLALGRIGS